MTTPTPDGEHEQHTKESGWDDAILVWNGMVTTTERSPDLSKRKLPISSDSSMERTGIEPATSGLES